MLSKMCFCHTDVWYRSFLDEQKETNEFFVKHLVTGSIVIRRIVQQRLSLKFCWCAETFELLHSKPCQNLLHIVRLRQTKLFWLSEELNTKEEVERSKVLHTEVRSKLQLIGLYHIHIRSDLYEIVNEQQEPSDISLENTKISSKLLILQFLSEFHPFLVRKSR